MSMLSWLLRKGIAGAISSDVVKKYLKIKSQHPNEEDEKILERVWNFWLTLNAEKIRAEDSEDKIARLSIIKEKNDKKTALNSLIALKSLFNLLPIVPLDGGVTLFLILDRLTGNRLPFNFYRLCYSVGLTVIVLAMFAILKNDLF